MDLGLEKSIINEYKKSYWNLPLFRNEKIGIPDELFEIKSILPQFLKIRRITTTDENIFFEGIEIPKYFKCKNIEIEFLGRTKADEKLSDNRLQFPVQKVEDDDRNIYNLKINTEELKSFEIYDIFFKVYYDGYYSEKLRISKKSVKDIRNKSKSVKAVLTKRDNLSVSTSKLEDLFTFNIDDESLKLDINKEGEIKKPLKAFIINLENIYLYIEIL